MELIRIVFSEEDVRSIAEEQGVDFETAMARAESWARSIQDTATQLCNEQLANVIATDQP